MAEKILKRVLCCAFCAALAGPALSTAALAKELVPVGQTVGIELTTDGMLIAALSKVKTAQGEQSPAADAGLRAGDIVVRMGQDRIVCAPDFVAASEKLDGGATTVTVTRDGRLIQYTVQPALSEEGGWKLGVWLRDGAAGIGTVTFYDPETGTYGALGHSICDVDTGVVLPVADGRITPATVTGVKAGQAGEPGELQGVFDADTELGDIGSNTVCGIFGAVEGGFGGEPLETASYGEITDGPAVILATVSSGEPAEYDVEVSRVFRAGEQKLLVTITDPELLSLTGGIVQGMSGCPIIQNGRLIGAVTHVLLSDPARGYGVSIDSMLDAQQAAQKTARQAA